MVRRGVYLALAVAAFLHAGQALACDGDCDGNGRITVEELVTGVGIRARTNSSTCFAAPVSLNDLTGAVEVALEGCPFIGQFYSTVALADGQTGHLSLTATADGTATGTLTISDSGAGTTGGAAATPSISLSGTFNLATGEFSISGSFDDGQGHTIPVAIGGTLPFPLAGAGVVTFQIGPDSYGGSIFAGSPPAPTATPTATPSGKVRTIVVGGATQAFDPEFLEIDVGDTVEWNWVGGPHSVRSSAIVGGFISCVADGVYDSGERSSGSFSHTFNQAGTFGYHCGVAGHCDNFESAIIQVGPAPPTATFTPSPTRTPIPPTPTATPMTIGGVAVDMIGIFAGTATAQSTGFQQPARIQIAVGDTVTVLDLQGTISYPSSSYVMTVVDPTHLSYHLSGTPEVSFTLNLSGPGHVTGVHHLIDPVMPYTPVLLDLTRVP